MGKIPPQVDELGSAISSGAVAANIATLGTPSSASDVLGPEESLPIDGFAVIADRPWLAQYDDGVPPTLKPYPSITLIDVVHRTATQRPAHPAMLFKGSQISYRDFDRWTDAVGRSLHMRGIQPGDRVAMLTPNSPQSLIAQFGAWKSGAIVAPLSPLYTERELRSALVEVGAKAIVVLTPFYRKVKRIQSSTSLELIIATNIKEYLRPLQRLLFTAFKETKDGHRIELSTNDVWLPSLIDDGMRQVDNLARPAPEDPAILLFTGGTTGEPKAALGTHQALVTSAMQTHAWFGPALREWEDVVVLAMPLFHVYGNLGILATSLIGHHPLALIPNPRDLGDVVRTIEQTRASFFPAVPSLFNALLAHPRVNRGKTDFTSVKLCISGSAPLMAESRRRFETLTGGTIVDAYSITEAMNAAIINPVRQSPRPGAIGVPLPDVELRIAALDGSGDAPPGVDGELLLRAPQLMTGYWGRPGETANMIVDGWLHTGDIGHVDNDGYVYVIDRRKDMIKPSGFAVWPREVEEAIAAHPDVVEVGVAGVPDSQQGEAVKAWVVLRAGVELSAENLRTWLRERLAPYKVPRYIEFRDVLPRSHVGKVLRRALVADTKGPRVSTIKVRGANLAFEEWGDAEQSVMFAHGVLLNRSIFSHQLASLQTYYRCIAFDFRGHGSSEVPDVGYGVDDLTDDTATLIRQTGSAPCHFVGHSLGAFVGLRLAARYPELIRTLVLIAGSADSQPRLDTLRYRLLQIVARRLGLAPLAPRLMRVLFSHNFLSDPDRATERDKWRLAIASQSLRGALYAVDGVLGRASVIGELSRITAPTLIVVGEHDTAAPLRMGKVLHKGIAGSELITVSAGHVPTVEQPEVTAAAIERFLASHRVPAAS